MRFSKRTAGIGGRRSTAWEIHMAARQAKQRGEDVIMLSVGDPDLDTPPAIAEAGIAAIRGGDTHYTEIQGRLPLREAIARHHGAVTGQSVTAANVIATAGAQNALFAAAQCLFDPGDEVLTFDPMYLTYEASLQAAGAVPVALEPAQGDGFRPNVAALADAVTPRTRGIWFANPSNPTGVAFTRDEVDAIADLARRHDLWVVSDEVYGSLTFDRPHVGIASLAGMAERTVTITSLSKAFSMTGWRLGWIVGPQPLIQHLYNLVLCMLYGLPGFIQAAATAALADDAATTAQMREVYRTRRDLAFEHLRDASGLVSHKPEAGMFMLVDVRGTGLSAYDFSWELFRETGVSVLDAGAFGEATEGFVRLAFTVGDDKLGEACDRIARFARGRAATTPAPARRAASA